MKKDEALLQWFLRLNGFLTLPNFVLHPARRGSQRSEVDVIGVRFPYRRELAESSVDLPVFVCSRPLLVLAEAKSSEQSLNRAWAESEGFVLEDVLLAIGVAPENCWPQVAESLRERGCAHVNDFELSFVFVGSPRPVELLELPEAIRLSWAEVLKFVFQRFNEFYRVKTQHDQWDETGQTLWNLTFEHRNFDGFAAAARRHFYIRE